MKRNTAYLAVAEASAAVLFWLEAMRVLFSVLFGVIYDTLFDAELSYQVVGAIMVAVLVALLLPAVSEKIRGRGRVIRLAMLTAIVTAAVARVPMTLNEPQVRLISAIVVLAATSVFLGLLLYRRVQMLPVALAGGLLADQVFRIPQLTWDISLHPTFLPLLIVLCLGLIGVAWTVYQRSEFLMVDDPPLKLGFGGGIALGALLFLETAALAQPNVLARWTETDYSVAAPALLIVSVLPLLALNSADWRAYGGFPLQWLARRGVLLRATLLFLLVGVAFLYGHRELGIAALSGLLLAQGALVMVIPMFLSPVYPDARNQSGRALALGMLCFFVLHLLFAFTFTYPYTVSALRDMGIVILLVAVLLAFSPAVLRPPALGEDKAIPFNNHLVVLFSLLLVAVFILSDAGLPHSRETGQTVRVATYNIHYGYDSDWAYSLDEQARAIENSRADIVFLQEVDAGRATSYGVDNALWLARRLDMQVIFAPTLEGLSGVAILTRLPVIDADWMLLPSEHEQTAIVHARLELVQGELDAFGVWFGLSEQERLNQVRAALATIGQAETVVFGGDMNSEPGSVVYQAIEAQEFSDPFVVLGRQDSLTDPAKEPVQRIDYVWSRGLTPIEAQVAPSLASDHRLVVAEFALP